MTLFFCAVIALIVFRGLVVKFIQKLPYTLTVLISVGSMLAFVILIKKIADDATAVLLLGLIGAAIGFVLELASMVCAMYAEEAKELYYRGIGQNNVDMKEDTEDVRSEGQ